ncbi:TonB-dependent receptor family protein [Gillisia limnaea]|uniref:TonB-dependent receptor n=1 Tax=Gillisia limnaea (strain DSM 15749 / LMG 21470 / R-8282) TaxID=865937 RepID=H2BZQ8_GILLR|nr:TonB-dependent receptor [Gillisia limnaea]EHQ03467.1 TonB-dependent receptor [Gillisia limnaea DSM 15749]
MRRCLFVAILGMASITFQAQEQKVKKSKDSVETLNEVIISAKVLLGSKFEVENRTGSAYYLSSEELKEHRYTNINRVLGQVPGVNFYEEDGFGLRPNISLRGTSPERSSKITLMEDGVLIAPAPYSAPAAYYFPSVARMEAVEILKGSSQIQYGPNTTGGAINFISSQIPTDFSGSLFANYGSFNTSNLHAKAGNSHKNIGYLVEYQNYRSDGFKDLDSGGDTGFNKDDIVAKFRVNTNPDAKVGQALDLKFQYSDETSDETYLGLTENDFNENPFRRYSGSQKDQMNADHLQLMATHTLSFSDYFRITTTGYLNEFSRNWYKLNDVVSAEGKVGISNLLDNPSNFPDAFAIVTGRINSGANALILKNNNREYVSKGVQTKLDYHWTTGNVFHDIEVGLRYHYDEEDRFQWVDAYNINNGIMNLTTAGTPGTDANRISNAKALATFAMYRIKFNNWTFTPGIRYENITLAQEDFGKNDVTRSGTDLKTKENKVDIFIPGVGFNYKFDNRVSLFGGVHKGFSPPGNSTGEDPEESINYELGSRFNVAGLQGELVGFYNDYSNLLGSDLAATGGTGTLEQFNAGEVEVKGIEFLLNYDLLERRSSQFRLPLNISYTYTNTEFQNSFASGEGIWGEINAGDEMPYIPNHQFNVGIGLEHSKFSVNLNGRYMGEFRTMAGSGDISNNERVDSNFIIDVAANYHLTSYLSFTGNVINALDNEYAVARVPSGLRPGHPFGAYLGLNFQF